MRLRFTSRAADELEDILAYVKQRSPDGAKRVRSRIRAISRHLAKHPYAGILTSSGLRKVLVTPYPYLVFYDFAGDAIIVIGVRHASRDPESMPGA